MATKRVWGHVPPGKIFNLDPIRLLLTESGTNFPKNTYILATIIIILNLGNSAWGGGGGGGGGNSRAPTPLYETLVHVSVVPGMKRRFLLLTSLELRDQV